MAAFCTTWVPFSVFILQYPLVHFICCNNENSIHHLEESVGQWEAEHLDQLLGTERQLEHGEAHLNVLSSSL